MTQEEIYRGITKKDRRVFTYLYDNNLESITRMINRKGGSEEEARDIFQEGVIALWMNIKHDKFTLQADTRISTYLYSICRNLWISRLRKKKKLRVVDNYEAELPDQFEEPFEEENPELTKLRRYFKKLDDKCQTLLKLFYYQKKSMREIAASMDITENTAKNNKYRCMIKMRALYDQNA